ncbi:endoplasmin-like [Argiope bruennichi]|uniref:Heat shock protein 83 n=1 Tax=Argiope bruennichi TaxID=94029 RepID=A0A8T0EKE4_ARGBR|nr:endoplasmin-like [Argiope bruennichi]KAF8774432.1 Endoplasmin like protein [Argiope bruennichi]
MRWLYLLILGVILLSGVSYAEETDEPVVEQDIGSSREGSRTDDEVVQREEEAIKLDGLNVAQLKELREKAEKFTFQAEVNRMMKLIINSLYRNKEIFLRELISNASDALDKIRVLSLTDRAALSATDELSIRIKSDKENNVLHVTDTGIGMTKAELIQNLGTIAKSGTSDFLQKVSESSSATELSDMIGQFGVGFYSSFLVADRVVVTSKHNEDKQHIWESDANSFNIAEDPRGDTLLRGTTVSLHLKEEARDFLEEDTLRNLIKKYSQFINFPIYLWTTKTETVEEPIEEEKDETTETPIDEEEDAKIEEEKEDKPKTKKVEKTVSDWELINISKPIWTRKPAEIKDEEYNEFYKSITKDTMDPLAKTHFIAEGEVTFKSLLFIPSVQPSESFNRYGSKVDHIKLYVRRVFITDDFQDMMPNYLGFVKGVVDSDDLPLNVSRETLQQHKLLKVIKKKLVRKTLDMIKKIPKEDYEKFWKEYSTNIKLGVIEDPSNRTRLAKLVRFLSSHDTKNYTSLSEYVERMKEKQEHIYYMAGASLEEVEKSPFVERLIRKGYEVLYLTEAVDEYAVSALPEFEGKKFQNVAKDGLRLDEGEKAKEIQEALNKEFEPLAKWLEEDVLKDKISKATVSQRLHSSPCALVASQFGWTGNMERLARSNAHSKIQDTTREYYLSQKKTLEINPRHPLMKELLHRIQSDKSDETAKNMANIMYETATLRSGFMLSDTSSFAQRVEILLRKTLGVPENAQVDEEPEISEEVEEEEQKAEDEEEDEDELDKTEEHDEL